MQLHFGCVPSSPESISKMLSLGITYDLSSPTVYLVS